MHDYSIALKHTLVLQNNTDNYTESIKKAAEKTSFHIQRRKITKHDVG